MLTARATKSDSLRYAATLMSPFLVWPVFMHTVDTRTHTRQHAREHPDTQTGKEGVARRCGAVAEWKAEHAQHAQGEHGTQAHAGHQQTHKKSRHTHAGAQRGRRKVAGERVAVRR